MGLSFTFIFVFFFVSKMATCTLPCPLFGWYFWHCKLLFCELLQDLLLCSSSFPGEELFKDVLSNKYVSRWMQTNHGCCCLSWKCCLALVSQLNSSSSSLIPFVYGVFYANFYELFTSLLLSSGLVFLLNSKNKHVLTL